MWVKLYVFDESLNLNFASKSVETFSINKESLIMSQQIFKFFYCYHLQYLWIYASQSLMLAKSLVSSTFTKKHEGKIQPFPLSKFIN